MTAMAASFKRRFQELGQQWTLLKRRRDSKHQPYEATHRSNDLIN